MWWAVPTFILLHALLTWQLLTLWRSYPVLVVAMSSTVSSRAQAYYDTGSGISETQSESAPVAEGTKPQILRFRLPNSIVKALRFDPLTAPGTVVLHSASVQRSDGSTALAFPLARIRGTLGFDQVETLSNGMRYRVRSDSNDPQFTLDLESPLDLRPRFPGNAVVLKIVLSNLLLLVFETIILYALSRIRLFADKRRHLNPKTALILLPLHILLCCAYYAYSFSPPMLRIEMSSSVFSRAQIYFDDGSGLSERKSSSVPVRPSSVLHELLLPLTNARIHYLRFDPITCPGTIVLGRVEVLRSDGTVVHSFPSSRINGILGFDEVENVQMGLRYRVRSDSYDPELILELDSALDLQSRNLSGAFYLKLALLNFALLAMEFFLLFWSPALSRSLSFARSLDTLVGVTASRLSSGGFLAFDKLAVYFYLSCALLFLIFTAADFNGSSMGVFWRNSKVGAPANIVAGTPQQIRADEFNYETPGILNQSFRENKFDVPASSFGGHSVALLGALPVRHISTLARPQYWPFFFLRADYAFSAWWQAKWLIFITGTFTFLLLLTESGTLALTGALWLFFSQFTQWCYTWPSMLPEMCGLLCFAVVFACYLTVGKRPLILALAAVACSVCAVDFALLAYVPHLIPYAWAGVIFLLAWCIANRLKIVRPIYRRPRFIAAAACLVITAAFLFTVLRDAQGAIHGIANTTYPGRRSLNGGELLLSTFGTHFLAAFEYDNHVPFTFANICEASGFLWLAPFTLLCLSKMKNLSRERRTLLAGLWVAFLLLFAWMVLPIPAFIGRFLFLDRVEAVRMLPALGLLNAAIVMLVLSSRQGHKRFRLDAKMVILLPVALFIVVLANHEVRGYFTIYQVAISALWTGVLAALLWDGRKFLFAAVLIIPHVFLFGLINPVQRGINTITASTLFEVVQNDRRLLQGKWLIFQDEFPSSIFIAAGCDVYNGSKYLPDIDHFPLLASRGVDTKILNNLGYLDIQELEPGQPPKATRGPFGVILGLSPLDPLVKELGIRYMAFHKRPSEAVRAYLKPLREGNISEFWLYEIL